ncbi:MAG TPA: hypothetical protein VIV06_09595 [Candidatus Limnocylindrales bacterium]
MGAPTDAARAEAVASRAALAEEVVRLEAAGRAAIDIPAKIRRAPAQTAGLAAGTAFLLLGGPGRLLRRLRIAIGGPDAVLPKSMLPKEVEKTLKTLGRDGDRVRGTIEREFAAYLESTRKEREGRDLAGTVSTLLGNVLKPATRRAGRQLAEQLFQPDGGSFDHAIRLIRERRGAGGPRASSTALTQPPPSSGVTQPAPGSAPAEPARSGPTESPS